jgi:hypothetical protein
MTSAHGLGTVLKRTVLEGEMQTWRYHEGLWLGAWTSGEGTMSTTNSVRQGAQMPLNRAQDQKARKAK